MAQTTKPRLVVFDVEGVLIPKNRFLFDVGKALGFFTLLKLLLLGFLYEVGIQKIEPTLRRIFAELRGTETELLSAVFQRIPATPFLKNLCGELKARNCKVAVISSGLPTFLVEKLAAEICADYAFGVDVEVRNGRLTGNITGDAIAKNGKLKILCGILNREGMLTSDCIVVADDRNNRCIFLPGTLKIGFNPDFILRIKADRVVNGKLASILPIIDGKREKRGFPQTNDLVREDIHAAGFFMPHIASLVGVPLVASLIIFIAILYTASELCRLEGRSLPLVSSVTRHAASQSELYGFAAAPIYFAVGIVATLLLYPSSPAGAAIAAFCLGDSAASLFGGMLTNSLPFNKGKTIEGSLAGFVFAFLAALFFVSPIWALVAAAVAMTIEVLPLPINDNVSVPIITGAVLTLLI